MRNKTNEKLHKINDGKCVVNKQLLKYFHIYDDWVPRSPQQCVCMIYMYPHIRIFTYYYIYYMEDRHESALSAYKGERKFTGLHVNMHIYIYTAMR